MRGNWWGIDLDGSHITAAQWNMRALLNTFKYTRRCLSTAGAVLARDCFPDGIPEDVLEILPEIMSDQYRSDVAIFGKSKRQNPGAAGRKLFANIVKAVEKFGELVVAIEDEVRLIKPFASRWASQGCVTRTQQQPEDPPFWPGVWQVKKWMNGETVKRDFGCEVNITNAHQLIEEVNEVRRVTAETYKTAGGVSVTLEVLVASSPIQSNGEAHGETE